MTLEEQAARWIVLLEARLATPADVINWSDSKIIQSQRPSPELIELSTIIDLMSMITHLRNLSSYIDRNEGLRCAAGTLRAAILDGRLSAEDVAAFSYRYLCGNLPGLPPDLRPLYSADDEFYLANTEQYGERSQVLYDFLEALKNVQKEA